MSSRSEIEFRKALKSDIPPLVELRIKQLVEEGYPEVSDIRQALVGYFSSSLKDGSLVCWVGISGGSIIATAGLCFYQLPPTFSNPTGRIAYLTNMYTVEACRRIGIASQLVDKLLTEAKALNYTSVKLHASHQGKGIYEQAGFVIADGYMGLKL